MTAAVYGVRAGKSVLVLDKAGFGGQIVNAASVENFPGFKGISGVDLAAAMHDQAEELGAEFAFAQVTGIEDQGDVKVVKTSSGDHEAKTVIIATGASNRKLGVEGELRLTGAGVSYCATCDGNFFRGKTVAVVGGGNTALEDALYLADIAETVYLIHRRDQFRGENSTVEKLRQRDNVQFVYNSQVTRLNADKRLQSIEVTDKQGNVTTLEVSGLFVAVGRIPENQNFASVVELDGAGYALAAENCRTKTPGVFVAGDNRVKEVRQLVTATADGAMAATEAVKYINNL
jgi:thioredoxin reductase (NADPH)